ncbi:MAG TPA: malectin domain-containing carbohydrate-binding protein, partial [Terriglobales bacterium]|nr:malectin domain-containing carbohydrate-binding protein [Terriglobales bacterium]
LPETTMGLPVGDEVRILAGASRSYVDRAGKLWGPDRYFSGGKPVRSSVQHIWRTQDTSIYRSSRQGDFRYDIPLKPGIYELRLHFAETFYGPEEIGGGGEGSRILMLQANGKLLLGDLDVALDAGGSRTADVKVFTGVSPSADGQLHLSFSSVRGGNAMLSAIEILPGLAGRQRPVRIVTRDVPYYSNDSRWWGPDDYFKGGQLAASDDAASDADDPEMFETERWGHFSYSIPVAPGRYTATFFFVEHRFDASNRDRYGDASADTSSRGPGGRLFSVFCNGKAILPNLDLIKEAGENRPLLRRVSGLEPNAQGKLLLEFVPTRSYATVTAIEVVAQPE